ncbi:Hypothetical protein PENO1_107220 [Penicillium occitanis (nom. inval.)]|nr:Hypothetical protein PENO1_107220 [Penicillium occitanis (nom. inval.)]PCG89166.1 hypothetical protein PENOC_107720 [Penicillium occitanis (nom. inval.)]
MSSRVVSLFSEASETRSLVDKIDLLNAVDGTLEYENLMQENADLRRAICQGRSMWKGTVELLREAFEAYLALKYVIEECAEAEESANRWWTETTGTKP